MVASLSALLPHPHQPVLGGIGADQDWLDSDLRQLLQDPKLPPKWRAQFVQIPVWGKAIDAGPIQAIDIYTDGSADGEVASTLTAPCAWAFSVWAVTAKGRFLIGWAAHSAVPPDTPYWVGETHEDAVEGETLALVWALTWILEWGRRFKVPMTLRYDAIAVGAGVFGAQRPPQRSGATAPSPLVELAVALRQRATVWCHLQHAHVAGHSGAIGNELCDQLAKWARRQHESPYDRLLPAWPARLLTHPLHGWSWLAHVSSSQLPALSALEAEAHRLQAQPQHTTVAPSMGTKQVSLPEAELAFDFTVVSYNVLTLFDPGVAHGRKVRAGSFGMQIAGKRALLKTQMMKCKVWALGLQETRLPTNALLPDSDLLMLNAAADDSGSYGCSLWLNLSIPIASIRGKPKCVHRDDIVVTGYSPRHLQVQVCTAWCRITILVAHGPRLVGDDAQQARDFWAHRQAELQKRPEGSSIIVLADANGRLGEVETDAVGNHALEPEGAAGAVFHDFLLQIGCCVPSTFKAFHEGSSWTWMGPAAFGDGSQRRIDYIAVPQDWKRFDLRSWVWEQLESMQSGHFLQWLRGTTSIPWECDPDSHFASLVPGLTQACAELVPETALPTTQAHLSPDTLALVRERAQLRGYLRCENRELRRRRLLIGFAAFIAGTRQQPVTAHAARTAQAWIRQIDHSIAAAVARLNALTIDLRRALKLDRAVYLHSLVQEVQLQEDGTFAQTPEDRQERWRLHFAQQEAGRAVTAEEYIDAFSRPDIPVLPNGPVFDPACLPTLGDIERQITAPSFDKAAGADGLTAEIYRVSPPGTAVCMMPLFLKTALQVREPVEWRGGCLVALAKKAAAALLCDNFRSILMASRTGKLYHRVVRTKLAPHLEAFKGPLQAGTSRGVGVDTVALMVRSFMGLFVRRSCTAAVTFYDIRAAYYRMVRHTLVPTLRDDRPLLALIHQLGLPPAAVNELHQHLTNLALLPAAGVGEHATALVADLFRGTWFRLDKSVVLTATSRGSRLGDPLADLLFGFSLAGYLAAVDEALERRHLTTHLPACASPMDWYDIPADDSANHVSWADDFAHLQSAVSEVALHQAVRTAATIHLELATAVGVELTFAVDKSAVLLPSMCVPVVDQHASLNPKGLPGYVLSDAVSGREHFLPVVDVYRHLGGIVTANCASTTEIAFRYSQARSVMKPLRKQLFANASVPLTIRIHLLRSLVLSRFVFSCAITDMTCAVHRRTWCKHYVGLWRALIRRKTKEEHLHSYRVLLTAGATSPLLALALARAVFLRRLFSTGPALLLHMLCVHWQLKPAQSWIAMLELDLRAVAVYNGAARTLLAAPCPVSSLLEAVREDGAWWPAQVRSAVKGFGLDLKEWDRQTPDTCAQAEPPVADLPFRCRWCTAAFRLHKHVAVHEARAHGSLSPSRHFAPVPYCLACHKWLHSVVRVQYHLRQHHVCLLRCAQVLPPLTLGEVHEAEAEDKAQEKARRRGAWQAHVAARPPLTFFGPRAPTAAEALDGLDEDELTMHRLQTVFRPSPAVLSWIQGTCERKSTEGPRSGTQEFWLRRPAHPFHNSNSFA
ncbi:unnamed protein product [Symbiodinium sp. CCMP2592]|nr:unnamed protein product [Symbiodinium sp. CCMP2592]